MDKPAPSRPVVLCILDGWGVAPPSEHNAIALARTPNWDRFMRECPHAVIEASELHVGLPDGQMGNSEVGHMNIGAGRVVMQDLPRIDRAIASGELAAKPELRAFIAKLEAARRDGRGVCHLIGLISPGGVHSHQAQLAALVRIVADAGIEVRVHALLDGRDTPPRSAMVYLRQFLADSADLPGVRVATVGGRYYAMDRDRRWERVELAYDCLVLAQGERAPDPLAAVEAAYARGEGDEFVRPTAIGEYRGMANGEGLLAGNFRADRMRQILSALLDPGFSGFARKRSVGFAAAAGMTEYSEELNRFLVTFFPSERLSNVLGQVVADAGLAQLRIAETEKYAHVTFFLNGGQEAEFLRESRILVESPKVATYDLKPEMSANEVTDKLVGAIGSMKFNLIIVNYANTDMVGHTGDLKAAIGAVEAVDRCLGRVAEALGRVGGAMLITADHGNAESMHDPVSGSAHTAHTLNRVPVALIGAGGGVRSLADGKLADIAPTVLALLGLSAPSEMTGISLLRGAASAGAAALRAR